MGARRWTGSVLLIGMMGSGKSTVARELAELLGWQVVDTDEAIEREAGATIPELFEVEGEAGFRARELAILRRVAAEERLVIATGGGALCREVAWDGIPDVARIVWLDAPVEVLIERVGSGGGRPLLQDGDEGPAGAIRRLLALREPFYRRAHARIDTSRRLPADVARAIAAWLSEEVT
jgi:shikimate kinase